MTAKPNTQSEAHATKQHHSAKEKKRFDHIDTRELIPAYAPNMIVPTWVDVHDFTLNAVAAMAAPRKSSDRQAYLSCVSRLVHWAIGPGSLKLDRVEIFHPDTISDFMQTISPDAGLDAHSRTRRLLLQMSDTLAHAELNDFPPPGYGCANVAPFVAADFPGLATWADNLSSPGRRRDADAMLAFCGGAGLTGAELLNARGQDLVFRDDGVFIFVPGEYSRSVPVNAQWEDRARSRFKNTPPRAHLAQAALSRRRRAYSGVTPGTRSVAVDAAELSERLRATWQERTFGNINLVAALHFAGSGITGGPAAVPELTKAIDFPVSAAILRGAGGAW